MINETRLASRLVAMQKISDEAKKNEPGIFRLAFTDSDWQGRNFLIDCMKQANLKIRVDAFGNVFARRDGTKNNLPPILFGSHGDSVPNGGNFDGVVGVLTGLEVMQSLEEENFQNEHPLEFVLFMCEESSRFGAATLGSRAFVGELSQDDLKRFCDAQTGQSLFDVLKERNLEPEKISVKNFEKKYKAFFEVHIEQGKVLEQRQLQIGVVTGIAAPTRVRVYLHGKADHSGATPMDLRQDSLCAAAEIILALEKIAGDVAKERPVVGTVGILKTKPCVMNVIPGETELGVDIRSIDADTKDFVTEKFSEAVQQICEKRNISFEIKPVSNERPVKLSQPLIDFLSDVCKKNNVAYCQMPSGAGHDAMHMAEYMPTGFLFIPCKDGISHNPNEFAKTDDIFLVTKLLEEAIKKISQENFLIQ